MKSLFKFIFILAAMLWLVQLSQPHWLAWMAFMEKFMSN